MADDPGYSDSIRKLTTAAEKDDAITAGNILNQLGPERWGKAVNDMLSLNQKDVNDMVQNKKWDVFIPTLSVEMDKAKTQETLTIYQQPAYGVKEPLPVAKVSQDITGADIPNPLDQKSDVVRQLTTAAENGDAVTTARILRRIGSENWAQTTRDMLEMNLRDRQKAPGDNRPAALTVGYESKGLEETLSLFQIPDYQTSLPLAKITNPRSFEKR